MSRRNSFREQQRATRQTIKQDERWFNGVTGIVVENKDPERQHRIKVIIPSIDEDKIYDEWVRAFVPVLGNGYGAVFIPPLDAEVILFGTLGEKYNLFYLSTYSEEMIVPPDFEDASVSGFRAPGDVKIIAGLDLFLRGGRVGIEADGSVHITAPGGLFVNGLKVG